MRKRQPIDGLVSIATRYCTAHNFRAPEKGGLWIVSANGLNRRWICANCKSAREARKEARA